MADGPSLPGIDVAALLAPIAPGAPTGVDLRQQPKSVFLEIEGLLDGKGVPDVIVADSEGRKSSRRDERALSQSVSEGLSRAVETLTKQSKDLEVATLCVQGLLSVHGYAGLWCGLSLVAELHERFWSDLYPNPPPKYRTHDDYDEPLPEPIPEPHVLTERRVLETRLRAVEKLEHLARSRVKLVPLFVADDGALCRVADWEAAATGDSELTEAELTERAQSQSKEVFAEQEAQLTGCIAACDRLDALLIQIYHRKPDPAHGLPELDPPPLALLRTELSSSRSLVRSLAEQSRSSSKGNRSSSIGKSDSEGVVAAPLKGGEVPLIRGSGKFAPKGRTEALGMLLAAAQCLHRNEPLSPLPRLVLQCLLWARSDSLRMWLEDMFRVSESEQDEIVRRLSLDAEPKLLSERLPGGCPVPKDRQEALAMLADVAAELQISEPLSPIPYRLAQVLSLASAGSPRAWLEHVFAADSPTRSRIESALGLGHK